jgi:hypothetical protein
MMRATQFGNYFIGGCAASSLLGWIASTSAMAQRAIAFLTAALAICWGLCWLLDFSISGWLKISVQNLQALLLAGLAMALIGTGVFLCS